MNLIVTGGCGFIGSHFIETMLRSYPDAHITNIDCLSYAAHPDTGRRLAQLSPYRYRFFRLDISSNDLDGVFAQIKPSAVINFAAETHVDRSIISPVEFVRTNVLGTQSILSLCRKYNVRLVHVSTDEVYGSLEPSAPTSTENAMLSPNSPYAASKASADLLVLACHRTYQQDVVITRCTNNFGPYQFPEKLLPLVIANALEDKAIPVYGDGRQVRDWIYAVDHCRAIDRVLQRGKSGEIYNISASQEEENIDVIRQVLDYLGKPLSLIQYVGDRPAHDRRYGLNATKIRSELGWTPVFEFQEALKITVNWYRSNRDWWEKIRNEDYYKYYQSNYAPKEAQQESFRQSTNALQHDDLQAHFNDVSTSPSTQRNSEVIQ